MVGDLVAGCNESTVHLILRFFSGLLQLPPTRNHATQVNLRKFLFGHCFGGAWAWVGGRACRAVYGRAFAIRRCAAASVKSKSVCMLR